MYIEDLLKAFKIDMKLLE